MTLDAARQIPPSIPALRTLGGGKAIAAILTISLAVLGLLIWLLYFNRAPGVRSGVVAALPALNATFNGISAGLLIAGYVAVRRRHYARHIKLMFAALASSALFLIGYIIYHSFHGDTKFQGTGTVRGVYFFILISHIVLSAIVVPMILTSLYLSLSGKLATHKRVSRWTLPVWLYVSVTGVLIFAMLKMWNG